MSWERLLERLRRANALVATAVGALLVLTAAYILVEIVLRQLGRSFGGTDEIAGYVMAITASWGLGYALVELAHVRIDLVHRRLPGAGRALLDVVAIAALALTVALVAFQCWPVLEKSLARGSRANTPLETPLWIPQGLWFGGWLWFAATALLMLSAAVGLLLQRRREPFERWFAAADEVAALAATERPGLSAERREGAPSETRRDVSAKTHESDPTRTRPDISTETPPGKDDDTP